MTKLTLSILLICLILAVTGLACIYGGNGGSGTDSSNSGNTVTAFGPDATATYGAEQFSIQLTAVATPGP